MLEVEVITDCKGQHLFVVHIDSVLEPPVVGEKIKCKVCGKEDARIRTVGVAGRIRKGDTPQSGGQTNIFGKE